MGLWPVGHHFLVTSRKLARATLIAAVALGLATLHSCNAFLAGSSPGQVGKQNLNLRKLSVGLPLAEPLVTSEVDIRSSDSAWKIVIGAAFLIGASARGMSRSPRTKKMISNVKLSPVISKAMPAGAFETQSCKHVAAHNRYPCQSLLDICTPIEDRGQKPTMRVPCTPVDVTAETPIHIQSGFLCVSSMVPILSEEAFCGKASGHRSTAGCARRAGKARFCSRRHRAYTSNYTSHAAHRRVGAGLQGVQHAEVQDMAYDPSCVRTKLQVGLQISSRTRLASSRVVKTLSTIKSSAKSSGVHNTQARELVGTRTKIRPKQKP